MSSSPDNEPPLARKPDQSAAVAGCGRTTIYRAIKVGAWLAGLPTVREAA